MASRVVYEDDYVVVLNKPHGLAVHPTRNTDEVSLSTITRSAGKRLQAAHRLDKVTSGALLLEKPHSLPTKVQTQFGDPGGEKTLKNYLALVGTQNRLGSTFDSLPRLALIDLPLRMRSKGSVQGVPGWQAIVYDDDEHRYMLPTELPADTGANQALTTFGVVWADGDRALVVLQLITGRTNQIRAHMQAVQHPIVGDPKYAAKAARPQELRTHLHAWRLEFDLPSSGERVGVQAEPDADFWVPIAERVSVPELMVNAATVAGELAEFTAGLGRKPPGREARQSRPSGGVTRVRRLREER